MSSQLTDAGAELIVGERYWLIFKPGEIRICASCHGLSSTDQTGGNVHDNPAEALRDLLQFWKLQYSGLFADGFESGTLSSWSAQTGA